MKLLRALRVLWKILCADEPLGAKRSAMTPRYLLVHSFIALLLSLIYCFTEEIVAKFGK